MSKLFWSTVTSARDRLVTPQESEWQDIADTLRDHLVNQPPSKDGLGIIGAKFRKGLHPRDSLSNPGQEYWRQQSMVESVSLMIFDIEDHDFGSDEKSALCSTIAGILSDACGGVAPAHIVYTTYNHGVSHVVDPRTGERKEKWKPNHPRLRLVIPLSTPASPQTARRLWAYLTAQLPGADVVCKDLARVQYTPRQQNPDSSLDPWLEPYDGPLLDVGVLPLWQHALDTTVERFADTADLTSRCKEVTTAVRGDGFAPKSLFSAVALQALATLEKLDAGEFQAFLLEAKASKVGLTSLRKAIKGTSPLQAGGDRTYAGSMGESDLAEALDAIRVPVSNGYEVWRNVGMALKDYSREGEISEAEALDLYVMWSRGEPGYTSDDDVFKAWEGYKGRGITIGTLIHLAKQGGWKPPKGAASLTGNPADGFVRGDQAEIAQYLQRAYRREAREPQITSGRHFLPPSSVHGLTKHLEQTTFPVVRTEGDLWHWNDETGVYEELNIERVKADICSLAGTPHGPKGQPLCVSDAYAKGAYGLLSANVATNSSSNSYFAHDAMEIPRVALRDKTLLLAPCANDGLVWWKADHHPMWRCRHALPFEADLDAECPRFFDFLADIWEGAPDVDERVACLQEFFGAALIGKATSFHRAILLLGEGSNGKSVLIKVLESLFDPRDVCHVPPQKMRHDDPNWHPLFRASLNTVAEVAQADLLETAVLKGVIAGDELSANRKYRDPISGRPAAAHMWGLNNLPAVSDHSHGFWRRWILLDFPHTYSDTPEGDEKQADPDLIDKLLKERPGILAWALKGAKRLAERQWKVTIPSSQDSLIADWRKDADSIRAWASAHANEDARKSAFDLYQRYRDWTTQGGNYPLSRHNFNRRLKGVATDLGINTVKRNGKTLYAIGHVPVLDTQDDDESRIDALELTMSLNIH